MNDPKLRISLAQYDIAWEDKAKNLALIESFLKQIKGTTDVLLLPEMATTGFSINAKKMAETNSGHTISQLKKWTKEYDIAIAGSFIATDGDKFYNRAFFLSSDAEHYYDKRHLFRMARESEIYTAGDKKVVFEYKGFNICLLICYDLRFPVLARNQNNAYDLLLYFASWPKTRSLVWKTLLRARAIENMSYVCGVNRVGIDGEKLEYTGDSMLIDAKGIDRICFDANESGIKTAEISKEEQNKFRAKFPVWMDADKFKIL